MPVASTSLTFQTNGDNHVIDINNDVANAIATAGIRNGVACIHVVGSTASITTTESEPGLVTHDLAAFFEKIAPANAYYKHEETWNDDNGHSHIRASLLGPSISVPLIDGKLALGTWQQIVLIDFDTRPRNRTVVVQVVGE